MANEQNDTQSPTSDPEALLSVVIKSRSKVYYNGLAQSVTSYNDKGIFDVLPEHANFISLINKRILVIDDRGAHHEFDIESGVMKVYQDKVDIYLEIV